MRGDRLLDRIEDVYRRRGEDFFRFALARLGDRELAHEAVQEGFARAIRGRSGFRETGSLEAWICRCVLNAASEPRPANPTLTDGSPEHGQHDETFDSSAEEVRAAIHSLSERQRDTVFLRYYLDLDYTTIAATMGVEVGTVSATLNAAHTRLREALQEVTR